MKLRQIGFLLVVIALLPALFYSVYEFSSLNENERLITEIYEQQLNSLLNSVNQYAWDRTNSWVNQINMYLTQYDKDRRMAMQVFMEHNTAVEAIFITDSLIQQAELIANENLLRPPKYNPAAIRQVFKTNLPVIRRLIHRKKVGYTKIEPFVLPPKDSTENKSLILMFITETDPQWIVVGMLLNSQRFIRDVLTPTLNQYADRNVTFGIFNLTDEKPEYTTGDIDLSSSRLTKKIWLFPDHVIGIKSLGLDIEEIARNRFQRSLLLILIIDSILIIGAVILYRNIKSEMEFARMKSDFVSNVSHELRTPLALIRMFSETLGMKRVKTDEQRNKYYKIITQETERLTHLINNILDFSKMEAGKKQFNFESLNLNDIVKHIIEFYSFHLENNGFTLKTEISEELLSLYADREAVSEALINLLENAVKYSQDERVITIRTGLHNETGFVEIEDRGIGISDADKKLIFDKFYRVSGGLVHDTKGSGLGLALVTYTMQAHGGNVTVNSTLGEGSCFRLSFPIEKES